MPYSLFTLGYSRVNDTYDEFLILNPEDQCDHQHK